MFDGVCPLPHPILSLRPLHYGIPLSELFSWVGTLLAHTQKRQVGQENHGSPSKSFFVNATAVNCIRSITDNAFAYHFKLRENV